MSTDKELLELAAKAAGFELLPEGVRLPLALETGDPKQIPWNPLTDDGDALRLAVKCGIDMTPFQGSKITRCRSLGHLDIEVGEPHESDPYAATRRAIVRAAAEIGRAA